MKTIVALAFLGLVSCQKSTEQEITSSSSETLSSEPKRDFDDALKNSNFGKDDKAGKYYDVRGFKMYCETYGEGDPILLIHGNGGNIANFVRQIPYFSKKYKVIVPDSRAQGKSIDKNDSLSYEMMADDLAELLRQMKIEKANVIGWSDGGINALLLAERHPEKVNKLVITGTNLWPDATAIEPGEWANMKKGFRELEAKLKSGEAKKPEDSLSYKLQKLMAENPHISKADLAKVKAPVLVVGGDHDMIRPEHTLEIFRMLPNASLWILPNSGHATLFGFADEFNAKAEAFFVTEFKARAENDKFF